MLSSIYTVTAECLSVGHASLEPQVSFSSEDMHLLQGVNSSSIRHVSTDGALSSGQPHPPVSCHGLGIFHDNPTLGTSSYSVPLSNYYLLPFPQSLLYPPPHLPLVHASRAHGQRS